MLINGWSENENDKDVYDNCSKEKCGVAGAEPKAKREDTQGPTWDGGPDERTSHF